MKKALIFLGVLAASFAQAQVLYVNNSNGTYQAIDTKEAGDVTFNEEQQLIRIKLNSSIASQFATKGITNIAPVSNNGTELTYDLDPKVTFNATDSENFNEIMETIITDEDNDESGDFVDNFKTSRIITITFSETGVKTTTLPDSITAKIDGGHIVINSAKGKIGYRVKGTCSNGSLKIYSDKKFQIMMQSLNLTNPTGPAINIQSGKTVYFTLLKNSINTLCDGATYSAPTVIDGKEEDQKGTIFSEGQLIINGDGTLNVTSLGGHAICSDDYIRVRGGNINILSAAKDGFRTKDKVIIGRTEEYSPNITINATSNGIECTKGALTIEAGKLDITSGGEAIKVVYEEEENFDPKVTPNAYIKGGYISIVTNGEKSSAIQTTGNYIQTGGIIQATVNGNGSKIINSDSTATISGGKLTGIVNGSIAADASSAGGIKSNSTLTITNATVAIECNGKGSKGFNCDSNVVIDNGNVTLLATAENYTDIADVKKTRAITAGSITINGGTVIAKAYNHAIAAQTSIAINSGIVNAYSTNSTALDANTTQSGGWLLTQDCNE